MDTIAERDHPVEGKARLRVNLSGGALALSLHKLAYLLALALAAWIVYRKLGLAVLRTAWFNLDLIWAGAALVVTGLLIFSF